MWERPLECLVRTYNYINKLSADPLSSYQRLRALKKRWDMPATLNPSSAGGRKRKGTATKDTADIAEGGAKDSAPKKKTRKTGKEAAGPVDEKDGTEAVVDV